MVIIDQRDAVLSCKFKEGFRVIYYIEATSLRPRQNIPHFPDDAFHCILLKYIHFLNDFIETLCSHGSNQQYSSIGLDNSLAPTRPQGIIWTNGGQLAGTYMGTQPWWVDFYVKLVV